MNYDRFLVCKYNNAQGVEKLERAEQLARLERVLRAGSPLGYNDAFVVPDGEPTAASDHLALVGEFSWRAPIITQPTFS